MGGKWRVVQEASEISAPHRMFGSSFERGLLKKDSRARDNYRGRAENSNLSLTIVN